MLDDQRVLPPCGLKTACAHMKNNKIDNVYRIQDERQKICNLSGRRNTSAHPLFPLV